MLVFPDPNDSTEYTDPNGDKWEFNGTGWVRQPAPVDDGDDGSNPISTPIKDTLIYSPDTLPWNNYGTQGFPAGEQWGTNGPPFMLKIDNQNWLTVNFKGGADQAFYWLKVSDGAPTGSLPFSNFKRLPYPAGVDGRGTVYNQFQAAGMAHHQSVVDGDTVYLYAGQEIIKLTESEAVFVAQAPAYDAEDSWVQGPTRTTRTYDRYQTANVGYLHNSSETDLTMLLIGEQSGTSRPLVKAKRFSKADGSVVSTTYSPPASYDNGGTTRYIYGGWIDDPRDPSDAIGFFIYGNYSNSDYPIPIIYHFKGSTGQLQTFNPSGQLINRRTANSNPHHFALVANSSDGFSFEWVNNFGSSTPLMQTIVFSLPSNRLSISTKTRFGTSHNLDYGVGGNKQGTGGYIDCVPVKGVMGTLMYTYPVTAPNLVSPSFGKYYVSFKGNSGVNDYYDGFLEQSWSKTMVDGIGTFNNDAIKHIHTKTIIGAAPQRQNISGNNATLRFLGVRSDTGDVIVHRYMPDKSTQIIYWRPNATSNLRVKVEDGKVVGSPVPESNGPEEFSSGTWLNVHTIADDLAEFEKLDDGTFEVDEENSVVIWNRKAVSMTEEEIRAMQESNEEQSE